MDLNYYFPAEWEPHRATWLSWPHNQDTWPGGIESIFKGYLHFIKEVSQHELVCINVFDAAMEAEASKMLKDEEVGLENIQFFQHATNDAWCRDHGPCFIIDSEGKKQVINWGYNAWGEKYPPFNLDNEIPSKVASALGLACIEPDFILEGGSVDFNGQGTVLTTSCCLLNPNRNPGVSKETVEGKLKKYFGVTQVLWLEHGIAGDDTDGHIDTLARFVGPETVVTIVEDDPSEINFDPLQKNLASLRAMRLPSGQPLKVVPLPMPNPRFHQGQRLPVSYANFYICNSAVIVPTFRDPNDSVAISILESLFKDRKVVGVDSYEIIRGLGSYHCLCMQEPVGTNDQ